MYFSARTEGRISYGHLGRTNLFFNTFYYKPFGLVIAELGIGP